MHLNSHTPRDPRAPDIAEDARTTVTGPHPLIRALTGIACGVAVGALASALMPAPARTAPPAREDSA